MSDSQKSSKTKVKPEAVKPMAALQGYLDDMLAVATTTAAVEEVTATLPETVTIEKTSEDVSPQIVEVPVVEVAEREIVVETHELPVETVIADQNEALFASEVINEPNAIETFKTPTSVVEEIVTEPEPVAPITIPQEPEIEVVEETTSFQQSLSEKAMSPEGVELAYPQWAASGFECLLFYVGGIKLAVPLILLGGIHRIDKELTPLFGQPDWFLGLYSKSSMDGQQNIRVVHTAKWVMPEKQCDDVDPINHYVISLGDSEWGLLSHQLSDSIRLSPDQVKWRTSAGKRPWLAGTVIDHMCAILDVNCLVDLLNQNSQRVS